MLSLSKTPFKLSRHELLGAVAVSILIKRLQELYPSKPVRDLSTKPQYGFTTSADWNGVGPRFVRITDIRGGTIDWDKVPRCSCDQANSYLLKDGDILVGRTGSVGKSFRVCDVPEPAVYASYLIRLRTSADYSSAYVYWCLQSTQFWDQILEMTRGSAIKNINGQMLSGLRFPVPPRDIQEQIASFLAGFVEYLNGRRPDIPELPPPFREQRRIVAKIERLAAKIDEAHGIRANSARSTTNVNLSVAKREFDRLAAEYGEKQIGSFEPHITSGPRSWSQYYTDKGVRFYRAQDIGPDGSVVDDAKQFITPPDGQQGRSAFVQRGDLLVVITGATVGRVALFQEEHEPGLVSQHVAICRLPANQVHPDYALHALRSPRGQEQLLGQRYGQGKPGLNLTNIRNIRLPIPPLPEQRRIVAYLDGLQAKVDQVKRLQTESAAELDALLPAILDRAFKGEL